ncbi:right-handed parallel beta-helix repeat-containing protein [Parvularcula maris]|uniref:Right-handed parallel beta-helix repeat-containing protein n=1 Tax=Parvularcula maris TaxID=2965077 RepID=A0A9X2L8L0_9PROT|nr:right-handed parallel beta-helix repeat-containing protein [Parvularcula maris]MCQ8185119.1 right-handed parallel beta-helix repeat-containing protein [Parvularcula maris]
MAKHALQTPPIALAALCTALALTAPAAAQIGGFETEISKPKKTEKIVKEHIVDVRTDSQWKGAKTIKEALARVKENGEIVVHPGTYRPEAITLTKSVSIRGLRDERGRMPVLEGSGSCLKVGSSKVSARVTSIMFVANSDQCVSISAGALEMTNTQIVGKRRSYAQPVSLNGESHLEPFNLDSVVKSPQALLSITGGRVRVSNSVIEGGNNGVRIHARDSASTYDHVELQNNTISQMSGAGVVLVGNVDADLSHNTITSNQMSGIVYAGTGQARLVGNTISNNRHNGLYVQGTGDAVSIEGNRFHDNVGDGIEVRSGTAILVGNQFGDHVSGCKVNSPSGKKGQASGVTLLADHVGMKQFDARGMCDQPKRRRKRS